MSSNRLKNIYFQSCFLSRPSALYPFNSVAVNSLIHSLFDEVLGEMRNGRISELASPTLVNFPLNAPRVDRFEAALLFVDMSGMVFPRFLILGVLIG